MDNHCLVEIVRKDGQCTRAHIGAGKQRDIVVVLNIVAFVSNSNGFMCRAKCSTICFCFRLSKLPPIAKSAVMKIKIIIAFLAAVTVGFAADTNNPPPATAQIEHGKYLVERVALCGECHSPRNDKGEFDRAQWLQGELISFKPDHPMPFAAIAPPIAGLPGYATDAAALKFLETGTNAAGKLAMAPMPPFRFNHEDALAVVAYLRSLKH